MPKEALTPYAVRTIYSPRKIEGFVLSRWMKLEALLRKLTGSSFPYLRFDTIPHSLRDENPNLEKPNFIVFTPAYKNSDREIRESFFPHEFCHVLGIDMGYHAPIIEAFLETIETYHYNPFFEKVLFPMLDFTNKGIDETSADEIAIDHGLEDRMLRCNIKFQLKDFHEEMEKMEKRDSINKLYAVIKGAHMPISFRHKGKRRHEEELIAFLRRGYRLIDAEGLFEEFLDVYDRARNPPQLSEVKGIFEYVVNRALGFLEK
jgi:hypothetical protein